MSIILRLVSILVTFIFLAVIIVLVKRGKLELKYSFLWIVLGILVLIGALFPHLVSTFASLLGFEVASNFVFFIALFFVLAMCLSLCVVVSKQSKQIKTLTQELAILKHDTKE